MDQNSLLALISLAIIGLWSPPSAAVVEPAVIFHSGDDTTVTLASSFVVHSELIQIQLGPSWVLSANKGTELSILDGGETGSSPGYVVRVLRGEATLIDLANDTSLKAPTGSILAGPGAIPCRDAVTTSCQGFGLIAPGNGTANDGDRNFARWDEQKNLTLSSAVMVKQQSYLDSIQIDIRDINSVFSSILRAFGKGQK